MSNLAKQRHKMVEFCIDWVHSGRELRSVAAWPSDVSPKSLSSHTNTHRQSHCSVSGLHWAPTRLWAPPAALWLTPINHQYRRWELQDTDQRQLTAALRRRVLIMNWLTKSLGKIPEIKPALLTSAASWILRSAAEAACHRQLTHAE